MAFGKKTQELTRQENTLHRMGLANTEDNRVSYFLSPEDLSERLRSNFHGPELLLEKASFLNPSSLKILNALP